MLALLLWLPLAAHAADFSLLDMQGKTHRLADYRGKWVLVNFWATWCPSCVSEIPELTSLHAARKDVVVIGVVMDYGSAPQVAEFARSHGVNYPVVLGSRRIAAQLGGVEVLPTSYLYSPTGEQVGYQAGELTRASIERYIREMQVN